MTTTERDDTYRVDRLQGSSNYRTWKFSMRMVLEAKDLWGIVSGVEKKPDKEPEAATWEKSAKKALALISLSLMAAEQQHIIDCTSPKVAWEILEKLYEGKGRNRKFMLLQELFGIKLDPEIGGMDDYLRSVKEKLSGLATVGIKLEDDIKLAIIFNGLPEQYRYLVVALEQQETIDFDDLTARLIEEERKVHPNPNGGGTAMMATKRNGQCHYCGQAGHWKRNCPVRKYREGKSPQNSEGEGSFRM